MDRGRQFEHRVAEFISSFGNYKILDDFFRY
jgi:hypothetical protein